MKLRKFKHRPRVKRSRTHLCGDPDWTREHCGTLDFWAFFGWLDISEDGTTWKSDEHGRWSLIHDLYGHDISKLSFSKRKLVRLFNDPDKLTEYVDRRVRLVEPKGGAWKSKIFKNYLKRQEANRRTTPRTGSPYTYRRTEQDEFVEITEEA